MNAATHTKIINSQQFNNNSMSLGFRRWSGLPSKVRHDLGVAYYLEFGNLDYHNYMVSFFGNMTDNEYKEYVITH